MLGNSMRKLSLSLAAQLHVEREIDSNKYRFVIGVDEVGRGSWAGPLCVGAVLYDLKHLLGFMTEKDADTFGMESQKLPNYSEYLRVNDSKKLSPRLRASLEQPIKALANGYGLGFVEPAELDKLGMTSGLTLGLERALAPLREFVGSSLLLLDGGVNFSGFPDVRTYVKGDSKSFAIASASILAKVERDALMERESIHFPWYVFEKNKGYPSPAHVSALHAIGPSQIHRKSWSYMENLPWQMPIHNTKQLQMEF